MTLSSWFILLLSPLGVTIPQIMAVFTVFGCIIIMAKDVRLGIMFMFILSALELAILYSLGQDITLHLTMTLSSFALMAISYLITYKKTQSPFEAM